MGFLIDNDYDRLIKDRVLDEIVANDRTLLDVCENRAIVELSELLSNIYDTSKIFAEVFDYDVAVAYPYEARVLYNGALYYVSDVNGASAGLDPSVDSEYTLGDTRSPLVVGDVVDVVLYHIHTRVTPRQVPQVRDDRYLAVIERYKDYQTGNRNAQLPILEDDESVVRGIIQGQNTKYYSGY